MRKLLALTLLLPLVLFSASTSLSANPATAITKLISRWLNENKKVYSDEMNRCYESRQHYIVDIDVRFGRFNSDNEKYLDSISARAQKYCEAVIPEERRYKKTVE
jgi:hypothetical protein